MLLITAVEAKLGELLSFFLKCSFFCTYMGLVSPLHLCSISIANLCSLLLMTSLNCVLSDPTYVIDSYCYWDGALFSNIARTKAKALIVKFTES